jgi:hypothetical protein
MDGVQLVGRVPGTAGHEYREVEKRVWLSQGSLQE